MCITDDMINCMITCNKIITKNPKRLMEEHGVNLRNDMELSSSDGQEHFSVFIRQNTQLPDNFSLGLIWKNAELNKNIILYRCNGPHGGNIKIKEHFKPHIHKINAKNIENEIYKPTIEGIEMTAEYNTFDEALSFFCLYCGIQDACNFFPQIRSQSLFSDI